MTQHLIEPYRFALPRDWTLAGALSASLSLCAGALALIVAGVVTATPAHAQASAGEVATDLRMAHEATAMRAAADAFVARAMAGEREAVLATLSPALVARIGQDTAVRVLDTQILPFFQRGRQVGRSTTVTRTTDAAGSHGFAFYQWLEPQDGSAARPFTLYVVREQGRLVVANIVPDRLVEGRHR